MDKTQVLKNRINYYIDKIEHLKNINNKYNHDYTKTINYYKQAILKLINGFMEE